MIAASGDITAVLSAMRNHRAAAAVQEDACIALRNIAANNAENEASIGTNGGIVDVIMAMQTHAAVVAVQQRACGALAQIAVSSVENKRRIAAGGGITAVLSAMRNHRAAVAVQEQACRALWNIAGGSVIAALFGWNGGIADVIMAMQTHATVAAVQENGCGALAKFGQDYDASEFSIAADGGITAVLSAMRNHRADSAVQEQACIALGLNIGDRNAKKTSNTSASIVPDSIGSNGGIDDVITAMQTHATIAAVQEKGCEALANIVRYSTLANLAWDRHWYCDENKQRELAAKDVENKKRIAADGGITAVLSAMRNHRAAAAVQEQACWALGNAAHDGHHDYTGNAELIGSKGGIVDVITAMQTHATVAAVQEKGCEALAKHCKVFQVQHSPHFG